MTHAPILSSDSHVFEPPDLWTTRIDVAFRDRAPRMQRLDGVDQLVVEAQQVIAGIGLISNAGVRFEAPETISSQGRFEDVHQGGYDPAQHLKDMQLDGVAGEVLYPSQGLFYFKVADTQLMSAIFRAYNDWLFELAWVPHLLSTMDYTYRERHEEAFYRFKDGRRPSDFFHRNVFLSPGRGRSRFGLRRQRWARLRETACPSGGRYDRPHQGSTIRGGEGSLCIPLYRCMPAPARCAVHMREGSSQHSGSLHSEHPLTAAVRRSPRAPAPPCPRPCIDPLSWRVFWYSLFYSSCT